MDVWYKTSVRSAVVHASRRVGLEPQLRLAHALLARGPERRNRMDDLGLLRLTRSLAREANCIDVGANRGGILRWFVASAPAGRHIAFEPLPDLASHLRTQFPRVTVHAVALSDTAGTSTFTRAEIDTRSSLSDGSNDAFTVRTERLDDLLPEDYAPSLIKVDVEGAEGLVFRGALRTLERWRPLVAFEHGDAAERFGTSHQDVHDLLTGCGLAIYDMKGRGPYTGEGFARADAWNFVAAADRDLDRVRRLGSLPL